MKSKIYLLFVLSLIMTGLLSCNLLTQTVEQEILVPTEIVTPIDSPVTPTLTEGVTTTNTAVLPTSTGTATEAADSDIPDATTETSYPATATQTSIPEGLATYTNPEADFALDYPEEWLIQNEDQPGLTVILWSSEPSEGGTEGVPDDVTKIDITTLPNSDLSLEEFVEQQKDNIASTNGQILDEEIITLDSGIQAVRLHVDSFGESISLLAVINDHPVSIVGFGDMNGFDPVARTLRPVERQDASVNSYTNTQGGFSLHLPTGWKVIGPIEAVNVADHTFDLYRLGIDPGPSGGPGPSSIAIADPDLWTPESFAISQCSTCPVNPFEEITLGGLPALKTSVGGGGVPFTSTWYFVEHLGNLIALDIHDEETLEPLEDVIQSIQFQP